MDERTASVVCALNLCADVPGTEPLVRSIIEAVTAQHERWVTFYVPYVESSQANEDPVSEMIAGMLPSYQVDAQLRAIAGRLGTEFQSKRCVLTGWKLKQDGIVWLEYRIDTDLFLTAN